MLNMSKYHVRGIIDKQMLYIFFKPFDGKVLHIKVNLSLYFFNFYDSNFNLKFIFYIFLCFLNITETFMLDSHCSFFYGQF